MPAPPGRAMPCRDETCQAVPAQPGPAGTGRTDPRQDCHAPQLPAMTRQATPRQAATGPASSRSCSCLPCQARTPPGHALTGPSPRRLAVPSQADQRHACRARSCHAPPRQTVPGPASPIPATSGRACRDLRRCFLHGGVDLPQTLESDLGDRFLLRTFGDAD